jgi:hypothetical protein
VRFDGIEFEPIEPDGELRRIRFAFWRLFAPEDGRALLDRVWRMHPDNRALLSSARFGNLLLAAGLEGARCYIESAAVTSALGESQRGEAHGLSGALRVRELEADLAALRNIKSWRVTASLRAISRAARRLPRPWPRSGETHRPAPSPTGR